MILRSLKLISFRSYDSLEISFEPGVTALVGPNAAGKTNLAEAIQLLSLARSFRTNDECALIKEGAKTAVVEATVQEGLMNRTIRIEVSKDGKKAFLNGKAVRRLSELAELVNVIAFCPADVALFAGSPGARRSFLDVSLSKQSLDYFRLLTKYNRILKERNALLKQPNPDQGLLDVLTEQLIQTAEPIVRYRSLYVARLNEVLPGVLSRLRGDNATAELIYRPFVKGDASFAERARKAFASNRESDLIHRTTSVGIQREDLSFLLNGKDVSEYGSQGENRIAVLALKLCPFFLVEDEAKKPICVLDDVTSELDATRVQNLFGILKEFGQTFVTTTNLDIDGASYVDVSPNKAIRRN